MNATLQTKTKTGAVFDYSGHLTPIYLIDDFVNTLQYFIYFFPLPNANANRDVAVIALDCQRGNC